MGSSARLPALRGFSHTDCPGNPPGRDARALPVPQRTSPGIAHHPGTPSPGTLTGTGLPVTPERVALGALTGEGSVCVDAGVLAAVVAQQAVVSPWEPQAGVSAAPGAFSRLPQVGGPQRALIPLSKEWRKGAGHLPLHSPHTLTPVAHLAPQGAGTHASRS